MLFFTLKCAKIKGKLAAFTFNSDKEQKLSTSTINIEITNKEKRRMNQRRLRAIEKSPTQPYAQFDRIIFFWPFGCINIILPLDILVFFVASAVTLSRLFIGLGIFA